MLLPIFMLLAALPPEVLDPPQAVDTSLTRIHAAKEYTLRVSIPGGGESVLKFNSELKEGGGEWIGWRVVPYVIPLVIPRDGKGTGQVALTLEFSGQKEATVLKSKGLAEDIYLLRVFADPKAYASWLDTFAPVSKTVVDWPEQVPELHGDAMEKIPKELEAAIKLGKDAYDVKRPELVRRFNKSYVYYAPAAQLRWSVFPGKDKDALTLQTSSWDIMFVARFRVDLKKTAKGEWEVARIMAGEIFKGE